MKRSTSLVLIGWLCFGLGGCTVFQGDAGDDVSHTEALTGTRWTLERIERADGSVNEPAQNEDFQYFVRFAENDSLTAQDACNGCGGTYETGAERSISIRPICTEMACGDDVPYADLLARATDATLPGLLASTPTPLAAAPRSVAMASPDVAGMESSDCATASNVVIHRV